MSWDDLTWRCDVCHEERPDARISVFKVERTLANCAVVGVNLKHCNDRAECDQRAPEEAERRLKAICDPA